MVSALIAVFLLWQISLPLTYYLGRDRHDERFAWRMFSALGWSQKRCNVTVTETVKSRDQVAVPAQDLALVIGSFANLVSRNRSAVVEKFLRSRCQVDYPVVRTRLVRTCPGKDGIDVPSGSMEINCFTGALTGNLDSP